MMTARRTLFGSLLALVLASAGCHRKSPPPPALTGPLAVDARPIRLGVYMKSAVPPELLKAAEDGVAKAMPELPITKDEKHKAPFALVSAPPVASYALPSRSSLDYFARGLSAAERDAVLGYQGVVVLSLYVSSDPQWRHVRDAEHLALELAKKSGGFIWDEDTRELFSADAWQRTRLDTWSDDLPDVASQMTIHFYENGEHHRAITLGMARLGLPDLVIQDTSPTTSDAALELIDAVAQLLVEGATPNERGQLRVDLGAIRAPRFRAGLAKLPADSSHVGFVGIAKAEPLEGDPDNRLIELRFDAFPGSTDLLRQQAAFKSLFGTEPSKPIRAPDGDPELAQVKVRVQARLPEVAETFRKGLGVGVRLIVKAPFATDDGSVEHMWMIPVRWEKDVTGTLTEDPFFIKRWRAGSEVHVPVADIEDYLLVKPNGEREGGESSAILEKRERGAR
jgi:uncharacterized protein YegJ (DUF2314 family)